MIVDNAILKRLAARFGVAPLSKQKPELQQLLQSGEHFIKAPAGFEPAITGGGYEWDDSINGYRLGQNQKIFLAPNGLAIWMFKDILVRPITPDSLQKWVSADAEYPMGKANAFFIIYGKLTGQDLGQNETAGDDVQDGETEPGGGGGLATADDENAPPYSKQDIQNMLKGEFPSDDTPSGPSMASSIPVAAGEEPPPTEVPIGGEEIPVKLHGPVPDRSKIGNKPGGYSEADNIIATLYKKAKINPKAKLSQQNPIRVDSDEIIDLYNRAKTLPPEDREKLIAFLKSGNIQPLQEGHISKATLEALMEHIINGIVQEVDKAKAKSKEKKNSSEAKKPEKPKGDYDFHGGSVPSKPPEHSQMDWEPSAEMRARPETPYEKWILSIANKMWKDPMEIGHGQHLWKIANKKQTEEGDEIYFLKKTKVIANRRYFAKRNGKWFYFNPESELKDRKWHPLNVNPPDEEPSIEQEVTGADAAGPVTGPNAFKQDRPLEEETTTDMGTPGYSIPGAFADGGGSWAGVKGSAKLGYHLTPIGRKEMKRKADKLYESLRKNLKRMIKEASGLGPDFDRAQRAYDNQMPPEDDGPLCPDCGIPLVYTGRGNRSAMCPDCGMVWGDDTSDALDR